MGKEPIHRCWSYSRVLFLAFLKFMDIDVITVGGSVNNGINEEKDCLAWIDDEYPGVSEVKDFD